MGQGELHRMVFCMASQSSKEKNLTLELASRGDPNAATGKQRAAIS